jgi:Family of unknown function (DUF6022)
MQTLETFLEAHEQTTIHILGDYARLHIADQWQQVLQTNQKKLQELFDHTGEGAAYGTYAQQLFKPIGTELKLNGFSSTPSFPGTLVTSIEWGKPEVRERWMWSVIEQKDIVLKDAMLGAIVVCLFHDHTRFRIPKSPDVLALEEVQKDKIIEAISQATNYSVDDVA